MLGVGGGKSEAKKERQKQNFFLKWCRRFKKLAGKIVILTRNSKSPADLVANRVAPRGPLTWPLTTVPPCSRILSSSSPLPVSWSTVAYTPPSRRRAKHLEKRKRPAIVYCYAALASTWWQVSVTFPVVRELVSPFCSAAVTPWLQLRTPATSAIGIGSCTLRLLLTTNPPTQHPSSNARDDLEVRHPPLQPPAPVGRWKPSVRVTAAETVGWLAVCVLVTLPGITWSKEGGGTEQNSSQNYVAFKGPGKNEYKIQKSDEFRFSEYR